MTATSKLLSTDLSERVLAKFGFSQYPTIDLDGLSMLYEAWCTKIPFDNVRKLIHIQSNNPNSLPGDNATDFFENWLAYGSGGTCWSGNGALYSLLSELGFTASRGVATMLVGHNLPPNHGTVIIDFKNDKYVVDASILHRMPLKLDVESLPVPKQLVWDAQASYHDGQWHILWRPLNRDHNIECRIEHLGATAEEFRERHELTRGWSPFNYELHVRLNHQDGILGIANNQRVRIGAGGETSKCDLLQSERIEFMVNELGMAEEIVLQLPPDKPTPPPPGSETARRQRPE